jgi:outer membrane protein
VALVAGQEQLRVQQENLAAQKLLENQIEQFVKAGTRPISDQYQQQASVAAASATVVDAQRTLELAKVDLIQTLQLDPTGSYDFVPPTVNDAAAIQRTYDLDSLMSRALAQRVDLHAQESRVEAAAQGVKAASASKWPTVSLSAGYNTSFNTATDLGFTDQLDQRRGGSLNVGISIPLFDRGSTVIAAERAELQKSNEELALQSQRQEIALQVRRTYLDFKAAQERLKAAEAQQRAAALAVQTSQERYRVGASTLVEVTQARAAQTQAESAVVNARYNLVFQTTVMSYYTGELDPAHASLS